VLKFFKKHKKIILRVVGVLMLLVGFVVPFWTVPKKGISKEELAAANVARMEASVAGSSQSATKQAKPKESPFMKEFKNTKQKQLEYLTIAAMIFGVGFLLYSFVKKEEEEV
jgi:flagellar basal body-associated protein FliL